MKKKQLKIAVISRNITLRNLQSVSQYNSDQHIATLTTLATLAYSNFDPAGMTGTVAKPWWQMARHEVHIHFILGFPDIPNRYMRRCALPTPPKSSMLLCHCIAKPWGLKVLLGASIRTLSTPKAWKRTRLGMPMSSQRSKWLNQ